MQSTHSVSCCQHATLIFCSFFVEQIFRRQTADDSPTSVVIKWGAQEAPKRAATAAEAPRLVKKVAEEVGGYEQQAEEQEGDAWASSSSVASLVDLGDPSGVAVEDEACAIEDGKSKVERRRERWRPKEEAVLTNAAKKHNATLDSDESKWTAVQAECALFAPMVQLISDSAMPTAICCPVFLGLW